MYTVKVVIIHICTFRIILTTKIKLIGMIIIKIQ